MIWPLIITRSLVLRCHVLRCHVLRSLELRCTILLIRIDLLVVVRSLSCLEWIVGLLIRVATTDRRCWGIYRILWNLLVHCWILNLNLNLLYFFFLFRLFLINIYCICRLLHVLSSSSLYTTPSNTYTTTNYWYPNSRGFWHF